MYRAFDCSTWDDPWFSEQDLETKVFFLFLFSNRRTTPCGAYEVTPRMIAFETGLDVSRVGELLRGCGERVRWWPEHSVVFVRNFYKHQKCNDNYRKGAQRAALDLPPEVRQAIYRAYPELEPAGNGSAAPGNPSGTHTLPLPDPPGIPGEPLPNRSQTVRNKSEEVEKSREEKSREESPPLPPVPGGEAAGGAVALLDAVALFVERFTEKSGGVPPDNIGRYARPLKVFEQRVGKDRYPRCLDGFFRDVWASEQGFAPSCFLGQSADRWDRQVAPLPGGGARASPRNGTYRPAGTLEDQKAAILAQLDG